MIRHPCGRPFREILPKLRVGSVLLWKVDGAVSCWAFRIEAIRPGEYARASFRNHHDFQGFETRAEALASLKDFDKEDGLTRRDYVLYQRGSYPLEIVGCGGEEG